MAKYYGIGSNLVGSAGDWTFSKNGRQTIAKQKIIAKSNPTRTYAQMVRRVQWANIINLYRAFGSHLHPSFESRADNMSDYNEFVSSNIGVVPIYLTKDEARQGGCVVSGYQVTRGSLPSIDITDNGGVATTDINLGSLTISATTDIKAFSEAVVANNDDYAFGDQITCFIARQSVNAASSVPYVKIESYEITLDKDDDETMLWDVVNAYGFSTVGSNLGASVAVAGAIVWIHSRKTVTGTRVSTQRFYTTNSIVANYNNVAHRTEAIQSYGGTITDPYLTPNINDEVEPTNP